MSKIIFVISIMIVSYRSPVLSNQLYHWSLGQHAETRTVVAVAAAAAARWRLNQWSSPQGVAPEIIGGAWPIRPSSMLCARHTDHHVDSSDSAKRLWRPLCYTSLPGPNPLLLATVSCCSCLYHMSCERALSYSTLGYHHDYLCMS